MFPPENESLHWYVLCTTLMSRLGKHKPTEYVKVYKKYKHHFPIPNNAFNALLESNTKSPLLEFVQKCGIDCIAGDLAYRYAATFHPIAWSYIIKFYQEADKDFMVADIFTGVAFVKTGGENILTLAAGGNNNLVCVLFILFSYESDHLECGNIDFYNHESDDEPCFTFECEDGAYLVGDLTNFYHKSSWLGGASVLFFCDKRVIFNFLQRSDAAYKDYKKLFPGGGRRTRRHLGNTRRCLQKNFSRTGGFFCLFDETKLRGKSSSCMQDAAALGAQYLGIDLSQRRIHKMCPPQNFIYTSIRALQTSLSKYMDFVQEKGIHQQKGGLEHVLLSFRDGGIRFVLVDINNPTWPKGHYCRRVRHAMIHVAARKNHVHKEHVGFLVDNQEEVPVFFIEEKDTLTKEISRLTLCTYFGGTFLRVRVTNFFRLYASGDKLFYPNFKKK